MKVYADEGGEKRLIGRADIPEDCGPVYEVPLFGPSSIIMERFTIATVTHLPTGGGILTERAVIVAPGQVVDLLPDWQPLAS